MVIGRADHVEVRGLTGDFPDAAVIESEADLPALPDHPRYGVISQTTQPSDKVRRLVEALRRARPGAEVCFRDTVCAPTRDRQESLRKLLLEAEVVIVVGGHASNNTRQLVLAAAGAGRRAYQIERPEELDPGWLAGAATVGLTAGTSTLPETVRRGPHPARSHRRAGRPLKAGHIARPCASSRHDAPQSLPAAGSPDWQRRATG